MCSSDLVTRDTLHLVAVVNFGSCSSPVSPVSQQLRMPRYQQQLGGSELAESPDSFPLQFCKEAKLFIVATFTLHVHFVYALVLLQSYLETMVIRLFLSTISAKKGYVFSLKAWDALKPSGRETEQAQKSMFSRIISQKP